MSAHFGRKNLDANLSVVQAANAMKKQWKAWALLAGWALVFFILLELKLRVALVFMPFILFGGILILVLTTIKTWPGTENNKTNNKSETTNDKH